MPGRAPWQFERPVEKLARVGNPLNSLDAVAGQERLEVAVSPLVHDHEPEPGRLDLWQGGGQVGDGLAAEHAAGVPQEHEQHWCLTREFGKRPPGVGRRFGERLSQVGRRNAGGRVGVDPEGMPEDHREGNPPDQVIGWERDAEGGGHRALE